jgi:predicted RND superfamily exporter protein
MNQLLNNNDKKFYKIPDTKNMVAQILLLYEMSGGTEASQWVDNDYTMLRLMVEIKDMDAENIRNTISMLEGISFEYFPDAEFSISGSMPQAAALNYYVATGQIRSFLLALFVIMILLITVFGSVKTGLIGMIPNISPAIAIGGLMGLLNIPLDFMTVTAMPLILGLAVDNTIHFISHIKLEYERTREYEKSILTTFKLVGKALIMTSVILIASFALYFISKINMFFNMGLFIVVGITVAMLSDCLITPVVINITKPFGKEKNN